MDSDQFVSKIMGALQQVVGTGPVALHEPCFAGNEWLYLKECLDSTYVSSVGKFVDWFEKDLAEYTGAKHAVAIVNGTAALHLALLIAGVEANDEVLVPALTFVATANAVKHCGATPHFVDSELTTLGVDPLALYDYLQTITEIRQGQCLNKKTGRIIRAVVPMHVFGHPVDMDGMMRVARDFHLHIVEDAAEGLGSLYHGRHVGTLGLLGTLSFNGNKTITTGGGGAILTDNANLAKRAKHLSTTAKMPHPWLFEHDAVAYNYRMPNLNAALGCAQLEQIDGFLLSKRRLLSRYQQAFSEVEGVRLMIEPDGSQSNYWLQALLLEKPHQNMRDTILDATNTCGLMTRPAWQLMHHLLPYKDCPRMSLAVSESLERRLMNIPSGVGI
mgnify:CR=1 FL=1